MKNKNIFHLLERIRNILICFLSLKTKGGSFKGKIRIEINCVNGNIANTNIKVSNGKKIDNDYTIVYNSTDELK